MTRRSRALALLAAAALAAPTSARADTRSTLDAARARLAALEGRIAAQEAEVARVNQALKDMAGRVDRQREDLAAVRRELRRTEADLAGTRAQLAALRDQIRRRARAVYVYGPATPLQVLLGAGSLQDLSTRVVYAATLVRRDAGLALQAERLGARLEAQQEAQARLLAKEAAELEQLRRQQRQLEAAFSSQQAKLADLVEARVELAGLIRQLADRLRAEELAAARRVAGRGMPITFGQWAEAFLAALGAPQSRNNLVAVVAWETAEYTLATWNPLATTYAMPGSTVYNSYGVRNYVSMEQGIEATIRTLRLPGHGYEAIVSALRSDADPMTTARAINDSDWCRGCAGGGYVVNLIPAVQAYYERYAGR